MELLTLVINPKFIISLEQDSTTSLRAGGHVTQSPSGQVIPHQYRLSTVLEVNLKYVALEMTTTK